MMASRTLARGLQLLELIAESPSGCAFRTMRAGLGLPSTTIARLLRSLLALGYLRHDPGDRLYKPGERLGWLGSQEDAEQRLRRLAMPAVRRLRAACACHVLLLRWTGRSAVCIERVPSEGPARFQEVGHVTRDLDSAPWGLFFGAVRVPADRRWRAWRRRELARLRAVGWTACRAEDRRRLAAPIRDGTGTVLGALVLAGGPDDIDRRMEVLGGLLAGEAQACSRLRQQA